MPQVKVREGVIVRACIDLIRHFGGHAERVNAGVAERGGRTIQLADEGCADILGAWFGRALAVEVKVPGQKPRPNQDAWRLKWEAAGGRYIVAHGTAELRAALGLKDTRQTGESP